jgi:5-methyltetrahydrofolate--homocysteine methyltransferase
MNQELYDGICKGNRKLVIQLVQSEIDNNCNPVELLMGSMIPAMRDVGDKFSRNEVFVPEMLIAARAMQSGLDLIEPKLTEAGHEPIAKVVVGTVKGDLHDIGKNLVVMMLKGAGFDVDDAGVDCDVIKFEKSVNDGAQAVCCSALLTTTMPYMKEVVEHFRGNEAKVVIGGAPVTQAYCEEIGADGFADNASDAVNAVASSLGLAI